MNNLSYLRTGGRPQINLVFLLLAVCSWSVARGSDDPKVTPQVLSFQSVRIGDDAFFVVQIARPADMATQTIELDPWLQRALVGWPRVAELRGHPAWQVPCYLEYETEGEYQPVTPLDRLTFVGRSTAQPTLDLVFRYPLSDGQWCEQNIRLDFSSAEPWPDESAAKQRWGAAQAQFFRMLARLTGDMGGFCTFAAEQTRSKCDLPVRESPEFARAGRPEPDEQLYAIATGALAIQESLQLDRMTRVDRTREKPSVEIASIPAVEVRSHPFDKMRGDAQPRYSALARVIPQTNYYVHFDNVAKLLELLDFADQWGTSLLRLAHPVGADFGTRARTHRQLCLPDNVLTRMLGPKIVGEFALTGSDPFLRDGSDLTIIFAVKDRNAFQAAVDLPFHQAAAAYPQAANDEIDHVGVKIERLVSARREISCYRCWLDDLCVYSNSPAGIRGVIDARAGRRPCLADAPGFRYMRAAVYPYDPQSEDGFLYLSDPFIRYLVGPELRIKQKRRLETITSLKLLANAAMFYGFQHGPSRPTFEDLVNDDSLNADDVFDAEGGYVTWDSDRSVATSSTYGELGFLTPLAEIDTTRATERERDEYAAFRSRYQQYWSQYFDPIGVRVRVDKTIRLDTCILPLIDSSEYDQLEDAAGGDAIAVNPGRFTPNTLLRCVMKLNDGSTKTQILTTLGGMTNTTTDWVGEWVTFWVEDTDAFTALVRNAYAGTDLDPVERRRRDQQQTLDVFNASFVLGLHVKNKLSLAAFLVSLRSFVETTAPDTVVFSNLPPYKETTIVRIAPDPRGDLARTLELENDESRDATGSQPAGGERGPAVYYATIDDGLYFSTQATALRGLIDQRELPPPDGGANEAVAANLLLYAAPGAAELVRPTVSFLLEQRARQVSLGNLMQVWLLGRCGLLEGDRALPTVAKSYLGYMPMCPNGGEYRYDEATEDAVSSVYGSLSAPRRLEALPDGSPLGLLLDTIQTVLASLEFTEHGVTTTVSIERR